MDNQIEHIMTFKELIQKHSWQSLTSTFLKIYPDVEKDIERYKTVFEKLMVMESERIDISIVVAVEKDEDDEYLEVSGLHNNPKTEDEKYLQGIELTPWRMWLGMDIHNESLQNFSEQEIIVRCLHEMTFCGFDEEDIPKRINQIENSRKETESMSKEERDSITATVEKILKEWGVEDID